MQTVMIVDDSNVVKKMIESFLSSLEVEIIGTASDGEEALELFKKEHPDLVTLDITMPKMDGLTCLESILKEKSDTKVLVISALKDRDTGIQALKLGAKSFMPKPFTADQLRKEFTRIMEQ
jgi:two-component system chemotaxis response regulator CheY